MARTMDGYRAADAAPALDVAQPLRYLRPDANASPATDMNSFAWFVFNCFVTIGWLATAIVTGNWFLAAGSGIWAAVLMLVDLPASSTSDEDTGDDDDGGLF